MTKHHGIELHGQASCIATRLHSQCSAILPRAKSLPVRIVMLWALPLSASAAVVEVQPGDDLEEAFNAAMPGDEIVLADGEYILTEARFGLTLAGTSALPIVIRAADGAQPHIHRSDVSQSIVDIDTAAWVVFRGIEFSGGVRGIEIHAADHLTIEDCEVHDTLTTGIDATEEESGYPSLHLIGNHVHHTGGVDPAISIGCFECDFSDGIIERNYVHHVGNDVPPVADYSGNEEGIYIDGGTSGIDVRDNVVHDTVSNCIGVPGNDGAGPSSTIERNAMWACGNAGIQISTDAVIRNNIVLSAGGDGISIATRQNQFPQNLLVVHNTVLAPANDAISVDSAYDTVIVANNAVYAQAGLGVYVGPGAMLDVIAAGNAGVGGVSAGIEGFVAGDLAADLIDGHYDGMPPVDVFPAAGGVLVAAGDPIYVPTDDFNGTPRGGEADVGAYAFDPDGNPGWTLEAEIKEPLDDDPGGSDSGGSDSGGSDGGQDETAGVDTEGTGAGSGTGGSAAGDGDGGGCGCRTESQRSTAVALLVLLAGFIRRRSRG